MSTWHLSEEEVEKYRRLNEHAKETGIANSAALPQHNPEATCPKCGADAFRIPAEYHKCSPDLYFGGLYPPSRQPCSFKYLGEHLCRTCGRCGYSWQERTVDTDAGVTTPAPSVHNGAA